MKESGRTLVRVVGALLLIAAAGLLGYFAYRAQNTGEASAQLTPVPEGAEAATDQEPTAAQPKRKPIPDTLPEFTLADRDGKPTPLSSYAGRPLMVNFWATWCAPCRREIPLLNKIRMERKPQNVEIVGVAVDFRDDVLEFVKTTRLDYPLLIGEEDGLAAAESFGMGMAFPFSVFSDSQNRILTVKVGELHEDEANFAFDRLRDIDNGVMTREAAQTAVAEAFREMAANRAQMEASSAGPKTN